MLCRQEWSRKARGEGRSPWHPERERHSPEIEGSGGDASRDAWEQEQQALVTGRAKAAQVWVHWCWPVSQGGVRKFPYSSFFILSKIRNRHISWPGNMKACEQQRQGDGKTPSAQGGRRTRGQGMWGACLSAPKDMQERGGDPLKPKPFRAVIFLQLRSNRWTPRWLCSKETGLRDRGERSERPMESKQGRRWDGSGAQQQRAGGKVSKLRRSQRDQRIFRWVTYIVKQICPMNFGLQILLFFKTRKQSLI